MGGGWAWYVYYDTIRIITYLILIILFVLRILRISARAYAYTRNACGARLA